MNHVCFGLYMFTYNSEIDAAKHQNQAFILIYL